MAAQNQDFITYQGDTPKPIFTVVAADGITPVDISQASAIVWTARRNLTDPVVLTKTKASGAITFVNTGTDGKFQVAITATDTAGLSDWYIHQAVITDVVGNITTVTVGRLQVGLTPDWTWVPSLVGVEDLYTVRSLIGDTVQSEQQLADQQVLWTISTFSNVFLAAAECCRMIAGYYARMVDTVQGELRTLYSQRTKRYTDLARVRDEQGFSRGGVTAYAGGTSLLDKQLNVVNTDRVPPQFLVGMFDNLLPESPVGQQAGAGQGLPSPASADPSVAGGPT